METIDTFVSVLVLLVAAHYLLDFPLQGDFMAAAKNPAKPIPGVPWLHAMFGHSFLHATGVYLITGMAWAFVFEFLTHFYADYSKCKYGGNTEASFNKDQYIHLCTKVVIAIVYAYLVYKETAL